MTKIALAPQLSLPVDVVTQTLLIVGKRGSGKSNTAARLVEQLHHAKIPFVVLDPVDTWWGLKASRDGTGPGLEGVYVFGGRKADLPLEPGEKSGVLIAETLCEHRIPMVLSVKHLSGRERSTFMVAFATTLFQKWAGGPLHVVLEEAHELAPQNVQTAKEGEQAMLGAFKRLWKLGRASGIGGSAITQRPASLSKDITTQSEILVAHRTIGPQDVKAIGEWIKYHGEQSEILAELPTLPTGTAFVWGPEFPEAKPIGLKRVEIPLRETYDSASTPKVGEHRVEPKALAAVDIDRLKTKMAATIERAKEEDPKELQKRVRDLERQLATRVDTHLDTAAVDADHLEREVQRAIADEGARHERYRKVVVRELGMLRADVTAAMTTLQTMADRADAILEVEVEEGGWVKPMPPVIVPPRAPRRPDPAPTRVATTSPQRHDVDGELSGPKRKILEACVQLEALGIPKPTLVQVALMVGISHTTGSYLQNVRELAGDGYLMRESGRVSLIDTGRAAAGDVEIPTRRQLHEFWLAKLDGPQGKILRELLSSYPEPLTIEQLGSQVGVSHTTGSFLQNVRDLDRLGLVHRTKGRAAATELLFPRGLR